MANRQKLVFDQNELPHIWAKQSQSEGKTTGRRMFFENKTIYSYGYHFAIARLLNDKQVLITGRGYSNTTAKHIHHVRYAVNHLERIACFYPEDESADRNFSVWTTELVNAISNIKNAKRDVFKFGHIVSLERIVANVEAYIKVMKIKITKKWDYSDHNRENLYRALKEARKYKYTPEMDEVRKAYLEVWRERGERAAATRRENQQKEWGRRSALSSLDAEEAGLLWATRTPFEGVEIQTGYAPWNMPVMLRLSKDEEQIETSKGARVYKHQGKILLDMIVTGRDIKGHDINGYTVIGLNGVLKIGCHEISRKEITRFARSMNWIDESVTLEEAH